MKIVATTTSSVKEIEEQFNLFLAETGIPLVKRNKHSLEKIKQEYNVNGVIVWEKDGPILNIEDQKFFFHPSMAKNRITAYRKKNEVDLMIKSCKLNIGDSFLDCTLGLGADAIVASYFSQTGKITGLESSFLIASTVKWGMKLYRTEMSWLNDAIKRVEVVNTYYKEYLSFLPDNSFDIVYFDPMFRNPILKSQPLSPLRMIANNSPIDNQSIEEACRVARKRVVLKETAKSHEFERLGFINVIRNKNNKIAYGFIEIS